MYVYMYMLALIVALLRRIRYWKGRALCVFFCSLDGWIDWDSSTTKLYTTEEEENEMKSTEIWDVLFVVVCARRRRRRRRKKERNRRAHALACFFFIIRRHDTSAHGRILDGDSTSTHPKHLPTQYEEEYETHTHTHTHTHKKKKKKVCGNWLEGFWSTYVSCLCLSIIHIIISRKKGVCSFLRAD